MDQVFDQTTQSKRVPTYSDLLDCTDRQQILGITLSGVRRQLKSYTVLPPVLSNVLMKEDNFEASNILLKFITKIKKLRSNDDDDSETDLSIPPPDGLATMCRPCDIKGAFIPTPGTPTPTFLPTSPERPPSQVHDLPEVLRPWEVRSNRLPPTQPGPHP